MIVSDGQTRGAGFDGITLVIGDPGARGAQRGGERGSEIMRLAVTRRNDRGFRLAQHEALDDIALMRVEAAGC